MSENKKIWRNCSVCKKPISTGAKYYICSVSTCNGQRTGYVFCSVACFERHLPGARHRDAAAIESTAPNEASAVNTGSASNTPTTQSQTVRRVVSSPTTTGASLANKMPQEILIIASRLKEYVQARADYNTSASVMEVLSDYVRVLCDRAIDNARAEGRKTVLDRDFDFLKKMRL